MKANGGTFLIDDFARQPLLAIPLVIGLLVGLGALFLRLNAIAFGEPLAAKARNDRSARHEFRRGTPFRTSTRKCWRV
jgi:hypothetical protein